jgi:hypothetical protein
MYGTLDRLQVPPADDALRVTFMVSPAMTAPPKHALIARIALLSDHIASHPPGKYLAPLGEATVLLNP